MPTWTEPLACAQLQEPSRAQASSGFTRWWSTPALIPTSRACGHLRMRFWRHVVRLLRAATKGGRAKLHRQHRRAGGRCGRGFLHLEGKSLADARLLLDELKQKGERIDYYCWDLYARTSQWYTSGLTKRTPSAKSCATPRCTS